MAFTGMFADPLPILALTALGAAGIYAALQIVALVGLFRGSKTAAPSPVSLSVIVAARNEASHVGTLLESLIRQTRLPDEIVMIDDRSDDGTSGVIALYRDRLPMMKVLRIDRLPADLAPKKHALERGIAESRGEILCFTDADVILPSTWLASVEAHFGAGVGVVVGSYAPPTRLDRPGFTASLLRRFIDYEKYKSWALSAGSLGWGFAWTASGSNLAYRRSVYEQVGGFAGQHASISGDDDLFVQRVRRETDWKIVAMTGSGATVTTEVPATWQEFYRQRTRHVSAGQWYDATSSIMLALYHSANVIATLSIFGGVFWPEHRFLTAYVAKVCSDLLLCALGDLRIQRSKAWTWFLPLEFVNLFYVITIGPLAWVWTPTWKGSSASR